MASSQDDGFICIQTIVHNMLIHLLQQLLVCVCGEAKLEVESGEKQLRKEETTEALALKEFV